MRNLAFCVIVRTVFYCNSEILPLHKSEELKHICLKFVIITGSQEKQAAKSLPR